MQVQQVPGLGMVIERVALEKPEMQVFVTNEQREG